MVTLQRKFGMISTRGWINVVTPQSLLSVFWLATFWIIKVIFSIRVILHCSDARPCTYLATVAVLCMLCGLICNVFGSARFKDLFAQLFLGLYQLWLSLARDLCHPLCVSRPCIYLCSFFSFFFFPFSTFFFFSFFILLLSFSAAFLSAWRAFTALMYACSPSSLPPICQFLSVACDHSCPSRKSRTP